MSPLSMKPGEEIRLILIFIVLSALYHILSYFCALAPIVPLPQQCCHHLPDPSNTILVIPPNQFNVLGYMHQKKNTRQNN